MKIIKHLVKKLFDRMGFEVHKINSNRLSQNMADVLARVSRLGFYPQTVIDVGVASGTPALYNAFPDSYILLIEPLEEFENSLKSILKKYKGSYVSAAAHSYSGQAEINVHSGHLDGSSLLKETMGSEVDGIGKTVRTCKIDDVVQENNLSGPYVIKIDVQGAELDVLEGAIETLKETELVILEVSMFQFMLNGPQFYDVVSYMKRRGFAAYDFFGGAPRPLDGALGQIDMAFVKENGQFRQDHSYSTAEQWRKIIGH